MKAYFLPVLLIGLFSISSSIGQNATTDPVGAMTIDFPATGPTPATTTKYISIPLHADAVFTGKPTAVSSDTLTFVSVNWSTSPSQFGANPANHVVRIMSGQQAGRILQVLSNTNNSITVSINDRTTQTTPLNFSGFSVTTSDRIEVVPCDTLAGIFGDGTPENPLLITGGTSAFTADTVGIVDRATGKTLAYFFHSTLRQWRRSGSTSSFDTMPIYPDDAVGVVRRSNRPASQLVLIGRVPTVAPLLKAAPGGSYMTTLGIPVDVKLQDITFTGAWTKGASLFVADTLGIYNPAFDRIVAYFQRSADNSWRASASASAADVSNTAIPAGSAVGILERTTNRTGAESFNKFSLPYTLATNQ